ncbi:MAG TPA: endonuclease domain-containing protein [Xanthomonadaceae bacterium]|nr:endonuclease domain-containing protein [Xanthomonadaceae bacterium]
MRAGQKTSFARILRGRTTDAEQRLWYRLRDRRLLGCKFRRQCPIGPYVVDFVCLERQLVVELDGSQHLDASTDVRRDAFLAANGFTILRFWNNEALASTDTVCGEIARWLAEHRPLPYRPPHGGLP